MQEFFRYVYAQNLLFVFVLMFSAVVLWAFFASNVNKNKKLLFQICKVFVFVFFLIIVSYRTLFSRTSIHSDVELIPFKHFFINGDHKAVIRSFFMNVFFFFPGGLVSPFLFSKRPYKRNVFFTIGFAAVLSAVIEFLQYYYHLGRCETDDVIANTLGATVGTLSYLLYIRILKNREESLMNSNISENQKLLLDLCAKSLFDKEFILPDDFDVKEVMNEATRQTVFPCCYSLIKDKCDADDGKTFSQIIAKNIRVEYAHNEVHRILSENNIPYVILKGVASASYYKEPTLRMMGDVDVLVSPDNIAKSDELLKSIGFVTDDNIVDDDMHIGYIRKDGVLCELHRRVNGIPQNEVGEIANKYFADIFEKSVEYNTSSGSCIMPSQFHHGLILLLHTASHLTSEGVGLRHLCDWAVFVNSFSNKKFLDMFEKPLKEIGLWRFARLLTLCCINYLGCDNRSWTGDCDGNIMNGIVADILNGGNFGYKDAERYNHIKYLSDRKDGSVSKKSAVLQLFSSINEKTKKEFKFTNKSKFFLPIGWIFTVCKYLYMVIMGKRSMDGVSTIKDAEMRKKIYKEFKLFQNDQV